MDASSGSKPACGCPRVQRWVPALSLLLSLGSITFCLLLSFRSAAVEQRLQAQISAALQPARSALQNQDGTLVPELSTPIGKLVEEVKIFIIFLFF